jgi:hypothetical protein
MSPLDRAKAAVRQTERRYWRISHAYDRLHRERYHNDPHSEPSEAEVRARQAYESASGEISMAREHLSLLSLVEPNPKPRRQRARHSLDASEGGDE